jgi:hypothetical protein
MMTTEFPDARTRWLRFAAVVGLFLVVGKLAGLLLFGEPLLSRPIPTVLGSLIFGWLVVLRRPVRPARLPDGTGV